MLVTESCVEYRLRLRGNYRDKVIPRYDLNIAIFDMIYRAITKHMTYLSEITRLTFIVTHSVITTQKTVNLSTTHEIQFYRLTNEAKTRIAEH